MPQIAQQDYLHLTIASSGALSESEKAQIKKHIAAETIFDVIITVDEDGYSSRVVAAADTTIAIVDAMAGELVVLSFPD